MILGCTHYPLLMQTIQEIVGTRTHLLDSALWTAKEVQDILKALGGLSTEKTGGLAASRFMVTDCAPQFQGTGRFVSRTALPSIESCHWRN